MFNMFKVGKRWIYLYLENCTPYIVTNHQKNSDMEAAEK